MNKDIDKFYKTNDFIYFDNKDKFKNSINDDYGYNFDTNKRSKVFLDDFIEKTKTFINKEYLDNHK